MLGNALRDALGNALGKVLAETEVPSKAAVPSMTAVPGDPSTASGAGFARAYS
ncbi:hypothetical protein [Microbacterium sp. STN6]|uniref:hypothetical protein n=1 Tax=Microbacterium sp. STN6 TaxID=2995588 RepID=UPI002B2136D7|nr:hypothetical protein [Microbacterium sp. STN6]